MAYKPPRGFRSGTKLGLKRTKNETNLKRDPLDSMVGFMRLLACPLRLFESTLCPLFCFTCSFEKLPVILSSGCSR